MPIYEYVCSACADRSDILLGVNDPGPKFCPACGAEGTMRKAFAPPTIVFKGSGWATKDRRTTSSSKSSGASSTSSSSSGSSSSDSSSSAGEGGGDGGSSTRSEPKPAGSSSASGDAD